MILLQNKNPLEDKNMKKTNNMKWVPVLFYITSACYFLVSCMHFLGHGSVGTGVVFMSLGSMNLALGTIWTKKVKDSEDTDQTSAEK